MNKALALILALLIGNPLCCCALALQTSNADAPIHSCCAKQANSTDTSEEDGEKKPCQCPCDKDGKALGESHEKVDVAPAKNLKPHHVWSSATDAELTLPRISTAAGHIAKWPPGRLPVLSSSERLARHCSYLI